MKRDLPFADLSEPDRAKKLTNDAGVAVWAAQVQAEMLPSTNRVAHAVRLMSDAYRLMEDAESLLSMDARGEPE